MLPGERIEEWDVESLATRPQRLLPDTSTIIDAKDGYLFEILVNHAPFGLEVTSHNERLLGIARDLRPEGMSPQVLVRMDNSLRSKGIRPDGGLMEATRRLEEAQTRTDHDRIIGALIKDGDLVESKGMLTIPDPKGSVERFLERRARRVSKALEVWEEARRREEKENGVTSEQPPVSPGYQQMPLSHSGPALG